MNKSLPALPKDEATERAVVASLLAMPKLLNDYWSILAQGEVFTHEGYKQLAQTMFALFQDGKPVQLVSVLKAIKQAGKWEQFAKTNISLDGLDVEGQIMESQQDCFTFGNYGSNASPFWVPRPF